MKLKVLGTQSPYSKSGHHCPGFLVIDGENKIMLDCGSGTHSLLNIPEDLNNLDVIITHLHEDHYNDVGVLQYASYVYKKLDETRTPITIHLPRFPRDKWRKIVNEENKFSTYVTIHEDLIEEIGEMKVYFLEVDHTTETYAVKIVKGEKSMVYTADMSFSSKEKIVEFAKGANLLICESSLLKRYGYPEVCAHLTAEQAGIIAKEAGVDKLILTHFWPEEPVENFQMEAETNFNNVICAIEGMIIEV